MKGWEIRKMAEFSKENPAAEEAKEPVSRNFIEQMIDKDLEEGVYETVHTRFPPEPNGYLHIGHAKSILLNYGLAKQYGGKFNLRFDDTNPTKEKIEFVESIKADVKWLGADWEDRLFFASNYFDQMYEGAVKLIQKGKAYVSDLSADQIREYRGTLTEPGKMDPGAERSVEENLALFEEMKAGKYADGEKVLRARIDMASPNMNMRDPVIYRVAHMTHHNTGDKWCIYPMYDFAHPIGDALEGVTHSLCSLEYEIHRPLYDWVVNVCNFKDKPRQIEFARLNLTNTVMSKRFLRRLVEEGYVSGWDDPRMPTLAGMRRRGYTSAAVRDFIDRVGVSKADSVVDVRLLEYCVRNDLNETAPRAMAVLDPVKVVLTNYEAGRSEDCVIENHPKKPEMGTHTVPLTREIYIEREDFMIDAPKKFFRLKPDGEVRLKGAYIIKCERYDVDENGNVTCIYCSVDFTSKSGSEGADRKVKGTIHWVSAEQNIPFEGRLYDVLMRDDDEQAEAAPEEEAEEETAAPAKDFIARLNPDSIKVIHGFAEPYLAQAKVGDDFQFLRMGYFCKDKDSTADMAVFNRVVPLKDSYKPE